MTIKKEELWNRMGIIYEELYHSGKNYIASIIGGKNGIYDESYYSIKNVSPKDKNEFNILNLSSIMIILMNNTTEPLHFCNGDEFICTLIYRNDNEYIFITKRNKPYICVEELICKKYNIEPTTENQKKIKELIEKRVYTYKDRDNNKKKRCIIFEEATKLNDYVINTTHYDMFNKDVELIKLKYLQGKKVSELIPEELLDISNYIKQTNRPILLYKKAGDSKLLVNEIPQFKTITYNELCKLLIDNIEYCKYCNCKLSIINKTYNNTNLTFDAVISLHGHNKNNIVLCCSLCNSKKTFNNKLNI